MDYIKKRKKVVVIRTGILFVLITLNMVDIIFKLSGFTKTTHLLLITNIVFLGLFVRILREMVQKLMMVAFNSGILFFIILFLQVVFAFIGYILFHKNTEARYFEDLGHSWFNLYVTFTLSNYPGITWPYYRKNRLSVLFFVIYVILTVHVFMNFLLAVIFNSYKEI